jgi:Uma2 family endonuclease
MSIAVQHAPLVKPDEYLVGEGVAECKHEYLNGVVYAMAGRTMRHNAIAVRITSRLYAQLAGKRCQPYNSDLLVRVRHGEDLRYYYPDVTIHCGSMEPGSHVIDDPAVIFEVMSESTARTDTGEKRLAYLTIATLEAYVLVDSDQRAVTVWRRTGNGWSPEVFTEPEESLTFANAGCTISLSEIYEGTGLSSGTENGRGT